MRNLFILLFVLTPFLLFPKRTKTEWTGVASFYHNKFNGRKTANGEIFSNNKLTAANNFLPLGTMVKVTNLRNKKSVVVKINDRLHPKNRRLIDLSYLAAKNIGMVNQGICKVKMELVKDE